MEESKLSDKEVNPNSKYILLDKIMCKNWSKRNSESPELMLSGKDEQMIFDCMLEYSGQQNKELMEENKKLQELNDSEYSIGFEDGQEDGQKELQELENKHEELQQKCERMEKALGEIIELCGTTNLSAHNQMKEAITGSLEIAEQSLNKG